MLVQRYAITDARNATLRWPFRDTPVLKLLNYLSAMHEEELTKAVAAAVLLYKWPFTDHGIPFKSCLQLRWAMDVFCLKQGQAVVLQTRGDKIRIAPL